MTEPSDMPTNLLGVLEALEPLVALTIGMKQKFLEAGFSTAIAEKLAMEMFSYAMTTAAEEAKKQ